jgi:thiol-disulfide isomerase/thioredoxin
MRLKLCIVLLAIVTDILNLNAQDISIAKKLSSDLLHYHSVYSMDSAFKSELRLQPGIQKDTVMYDDILSSIAMAYASAGNTKKVNDYMALLEDTKGKYFHYFRVGRAYYSMGNVDESILNLSQSFNHCINIIKCFPNYQINSMPPSSIMASSAYFLSECYTRKKEYIKAIATIDTALNYVSEKNGYGLMQNKADILYGSKDYPQALSVYISLYNHGNESDGLKNKIKNTYINAGYTASSYNNFFDSLSLVYHKLLADSINKFSLHVPAPQFKFKDSTGAFVKLSDYKGKIIVLDFWATWCGPCVASFPMMQDAVNKFKKDSSVVFLFIDTWEYAENPEQNVLAFLHKDKYDFNILFDIKDAQTKEFINVKQFGIDGIPAKFVIDDKGFIRYRLKGFSGDIKNSVDELSLMINNARKS